MSQELARKFDELSQHILDLADIDGATCDDLDAKISSLSTQLTIQKRLDETLKLIRENQPLPLRRLSYNLKKLCESGTPSDSRWSKLQKLEFRSLIFCMLCFAGLPSLPAQQFSWLLENIERYLGTRSLPPSWIGHDQILKTVANVPKQDHTKAFLESLFHEYLSSHKVVNELLGYHRVEIELCKLSGSDVTEKEPPTEPRNIESFVDNGDHPFSKYQPPRQMTPRRAVPCIDLITRLLYWRRLRTYIGRCSSYCGI